MDLPQQSTPKSAPQYRTSLSRSLVRTLMIFTFIPLTLMSGAAYLRARTLLRDQVVNQMQAQMTTQLNQVDLAIKTKEIRLDRLVRSQTFASDFEVALHANPQSAEFTNVRNNINNEMRTLNPESGKATFNQFFLMKTDGTIGIASKPEWEGLSLKNTSFYSLISERDHQSFILYNLAPLYSNQFVLITISQYQTQTGSRIGTLVGISEAQSIQDILQSLVALTPSANAYFLIPSSETFVGIDSYIGQLKAFTPSSSQKTSLTTAVAALMGKDETPRSLDFTASDGNPVIAQVEWVDSLNAGVVLEIRQDTIYGSLNSLVPFTIGLFIIALLAMGVVISFGTNQVFRPLVKLTEITRKFSEGDFSQRAESRRNDEIGLLAQSFNHMAEELTELYRSLEQKVDERTRQIRTAAEVARQITSSSNLDDLLNKTVQLIVEQFDFYHAGIFMLDRGGKYALLRAAYSPAAKAMLERAHRLEVGSASVIGWVSANNRPRITSDVAEDAIHFKNELLPETRSEVGVPISVGDLVLGVLDVQSTFPNAFGPDTMVMLETLASQIAVAIQNVGLAESTQVNFQELERLYRASRQIAASQSDKEALQAAGRVLKDSPYPAVVMSLQNGRLNIETLTDGDESEAILAALPNMDRNLAEVDKFLSGSPIIVDTTSTHVPMALTRFIRQMNYQSAAFLPLLQGGRLAGLIIIGGRKQTLTSAIIQPYASMADLVGATLDKIEEADQKLEQLKEREALASVSQAISASSTDLNTFFLKLHNEIKQVIGNYAFLVALYDKTTESISIPYFYEDGNVDKIESFPLGEGLTSVLIRSARPLMIVEDTEKRAAELGAKIVGKAARSWMGAPMMIQNQPIGALIIQDAEHERVFSEENLRFLTALSNQVAGVLYNVQLLEESRSRALQLQTAAEIARDISGSLNLDELLAKAVNYIRERFDFYHASIFLIDSTGEYAVIREATGEAGAQLKRSGHKLGVGSKSIVGYVAGRGEPLIVNDAIKDATYYANPLLPDTRSEAAIPLKVGERIVGALDVQSIHPFAFSEDNMRTLQILADQMAVAVVNSELFAETQEHLSQHRLLHHITTTAASGTTLEEALESAVSGLQVTLGGDRVAILLMDSERKSLETKASIGYSEEIKHVRVPLGSGVTGWAAAHRRPLRVDDTTADPRYIQASPNTRSELAIPLIYRNEVLGVLNVESEKQSAYTDNDEEMLGTLGGSLAAVIANARLLEQIRNQSERERMLYEMTSKIRRSTDIQTILATTASELTKAVGAKQVGIKISSGIKESDENSSKDNVQ